VTLNAVNRPKRKLHMLQYGVYQIIFLWKFKDNQLKERYSYNYAEAFIYNSLKEESRQLS